MIDAPRIPADGEIAVIGLGRSGRAVTRLLRREGLRVYASDAGHVADANELRSTGADVEVGSHDLERIARCALLVVSPGIPPAAGPVATANRAGVPVVSEVEIALRFLTGVRCAAVTGTNGKSTTTAMIGHLLRAAGRTAEVAGNIGTALSEVASGAERPEWIALEMSSFQLHDTPSVAPDVGVLTNLAPDHLDRYSSVEEYYADKELLFRNGTEASLWVVNGEDERVMEMSSRAHGRRFTFGPGSGFDARVEDGRLVVLGESLLERRELPLLGDHNVANALAAALTVIVADERHRSHDVRARIAEGLRTFRGLDHRLELVGEFGGVQWINDSKATNVASTLVAVEGMTRPTILLLGGRHKGEPYTALAAPARSRVRKVIAYGEAAREIGNDLNPDLDVETVSGGFDEVVDRARTLARPGEAVLLSPACSSYDMFDNYERRGDRFRELARRGVNG